MKELILATNNAGKLKELASMLKDVKLLSLSEIGFKDETPEPYETFEENAYTKAHAVNEFSGKNVLSDDSGLCVDTLNGKPGVHSAYFGGEPRNDSKNMQHLLKLLENNDNRNAHFIATLCLIWDSEVHYFEGKCYGEIAFKASGENGFGYDPIFIPDGYNETFGTLPPEVKKSVSHRTKALEKLQAFIRQKLSAS